MKGHTFLSMIYPFALALAMVCSVDEALAITQAQQENNLKSGEEIPKGHAHFPYLKGYMYIGSQGFHDIGRPVSYVDPTH